MTHRYPPHCLTLVALTLTLTLAAAAPHAQSNTFVGWGRASEGQLSSPAVTSDIVSVSFGAYHSLALRSDGTVVGWGYGVEGQATVPAGLSNVVSVSAGGVHSLALKSDGTVVGWGHNDWGQATVPAGLSDVVAMSAGLYHSLALKSDGTVVGWGFNGSRQASPPPDLTDVVAISAGRFHSLALKSDGTVVSWGDNFYGQTAVPLGLSDVVAIGAGDFHSLALVETPAPVEVTFSVDMTFNPLAPGQIAGLRGSVEPLGWESTTVLSDDDGDGVYTGTVTFDATTAGQTLEYKFVRHDAGIDPPSTGDGIEFEGDVGIDVNGDSYANRLLALPAVSTVLPVVFWNNLVLCSTEAPFAVGAFDPAAGTVTLTNGLATEEADLADCTLAVFDPLEETVIDAVTSAARVEAGGTATLEATLTAGPGAFALVEGAVAPDAGVLDVLGRVVAAVVYGADGSVYGACGNGAGVASCPSPEGRATLAAALAAAYGGAVTDEAGPDAALALGVWPNPSAGATRVAFGLEAAGSARVSVYDALGREVAVLADGAYAAGRHEAVLDARALPAGVYVVRTVTPDGARTARLTVAR